MHTGQAFFLLMMLTLPGGTFAAQDDVVLGKPSPIRPSAREQETLVLDSGTQLRQQPRPDSPVLEILEMSVELPVLERRDGWIKVRFGVWQGWVHPGVDPAAAAGNLSFSLAPDDQRLLHARVLLGEGVESRPLGPFVLYSDVRDEPLLAWLGSVAIDIFRAYRERFGLDPGSEVHEIVVLFADEADYRSFVSVESRIAQADSRGYTSEGLSVLFTGEHDRASLVSVFIHELTHLLNRRVFRSETPPWLEEGIAEDLAFSRVDQQGQIQLGTLAGASLQGLADRYSHGEPRAHVSALIAAWATPSRPDLATLVTMDWDDFIHPGNRAIHYAASAMMVRYFLDGGKEGLRRGFSEFLREVSHADLSGSVSLWEDLAATPQEIEKDLHRFVLKEARAYGL